MLLAVAFLAVAHVDDRYGVSAAPDVWMGLAAAAHAAVWYPPAFAHGFYGGTRDTPVPVLLQLGGRVVSGEDLAPRQGSGPAECPVAPLGRWS